MKEPFTIDLIEGKPEYFGALLETDERRASENRVKIKIRPMQASFKKFLIPQGAVWTDYELDPEQDIVKKQVGKLELAFLVPNTDIPGVDNSSTIWSRLNGVSETRAAELEKELKNTRKKLSAAQKNLRRYEEDDTEDESSGGRKGLMCNNCGKTFPEETWFDEGGVCPSCGQINEDKRRF